MALRAMSAFVLAVFADDNREGQKVCIEAGFIEIACGFLTNVDEGLFLGVDVPLISPDRGLEGDSGAEEMEEDEEVVAAVNQRLADTAELWQWLCWALGKVWQNFEMAQREALDADVVPILVNLLAHSDPSVRAAAVFALGSLVGRHGGYSDANNAETEFSVNVGLIGAELAPVLDDGSHTVRAELASALSPLVSLYQQRFIEAAERWREDEKSHRKTNDPTNMVLRTVYRLTSDPHPTVAQAASVMLASLGIKATRKPGSRPRQISQTSSNGTARMPSSTASSVETAAATSPVTGSSGSPISPFWPSMPTPKFITPRKAGNGVAAAAAAAAAATGGGVGGGTASETLADAEIAALCNGLERIADGLRAHNGSAPAAGKAKAAAKEPAAETMAQLRGLLNGATETFPTLQGILQRYGWDGRRFRDGHPLIQTLVSLADTIRGDPSLGACSSLYLFTTGFFAWSCQNYCCWTRAEDREPGRHCRSRAAGQQWRQERNEAVRMSAHDLMSPRNARLKLNETIFHTPTDEVTARPCLFPAPPRTPAHPHTRIFPPSNSVRWSADDPIARGAGRPTAVCDHSVG